MSMVASVIAHESNWDEIALIAAPLIVVGVLLWLANRWAKNKAEADES